jgi:hypothetical protein
MSADGAAVSLAPALENSSSEQVRALRGVRSSRGRPLAGSASGRLGRSCQARCAVGLARRSDPPSRTPMCALAKRTARNCAEHGIRRLSEQLALNREVGLRSPRSVIDVADDSGSRGFPEVVALPIASGTSPNVKGSYDRAGERVGTGNVGTNSTLTGIPRLSEPGYACLRVKQHDDQLGRLAHRSSPASRSLV